MHAGEGYFTLEFSDDDDLKRTDLRYPQLFTPCFRLSRGSFLPYFLVCFLKYADGRIAMTEPRQRVQNLQIVLCLGKHVALKQVTVFYALILH